MDNSKVQEILEKQMLTVAKAVDDKIDDEIAVLDRLDIDDMEELRERRPQRMKKMADKRRRWISLGHGDSSEIPVEKDFFSIVEASDRVVAISIVKTGNASNRSVKMLAFNIRASTRTDVMDKHLSILAKQHIETRKVDFDELGGTEEFSTEELEERLATSQVIFFEGESSFNSYKTSGKSRTVPEKLKARLIRFRLAI